MKRIKHIGSKVYSSLSSASSLRFTIEIEIKQSYAIACRHGPGHTLSPTTVNYRANIEALRVAGCTHILASTACGSLQESISKGQLVIPDSFVDRTFSRNVTFYDGTSAKYPGK